MDPALESDMDLQCLIPTKYYSLKLYFGTHLPVKKIRHLQSSINVEDIAICIYLRVAIVDICINLIIALSYSHTEPTLVHLKPVIKLQFMDQPPCFSAIFTKEKFSRLSDCSSGG